MAGSLPVDAGDARIEAAGGGRFGAVSEQADGILGSERIWKSDGLLRAGFGAGTRGPLEGRESLACLGGWLGGGCDGEPALPASSTSSVHLVGGRVSKFEVKSLQSARG